jgi:putative RecB family exonuclease
MGIQINGYDLPMYVSYSALTTWLECGWKYYLTRLQKLPEKPSWWLVGGSAVHLATEKYDKAMLETGEVIENLDLLFSLCWDEEFAATQAETTVPPEQWAAASRGKEDEEWWLKSGPRMLAQWAAWHTPDNPWQVWRTPEGQPAVELELNLMLGGVPVKMIIDRVLENQQGDLMVCDIKTGSSMPKHNLQLAFYAAGLDQMFGVRPRWGAYWMGRSGSTSPLVDLTHLSTDKIVDIVVKFEKARHQQVFLPNLSSCSMCGVKNACHWAGMTMEGK